MSNAGEEAQFLDPELLEIHRVDVARARGVEVVILYSSCATFLLMLGCVVIFKDRKMTVLCAGHRYELPFDLNQV